MSDSSEADAYKSQIIQQLFEASWGRRDLVLKSFQDHTYQMEAIAALTADPVQNIRTFLQGDARLFDVTHLERILKEFAMQFPVAIPTLIEWEWGKDKDASIRQICAQLGVEDYEVQLAVLASDALIENVAPPMLRSKAQHELVGEISALNLVAFQECEEKNCGGFHFQEDDEEFYAYSGDYYQYAEKNDEIINAMAQAVIDLQYQDAAYDSDEIHYAFYASLFYAGVLNDIEQINENAQVSMAIEIALADNDCAVDPVLDEDSLEMYAHIMDGIGRDY